jgi:hypothetical protein
MASFKFVAWPGGKDENPETLSQEVVSSGISIRHVSKASILRKTHCEFQLSERNMHERSNIQDDSKF